MTLCRFRMADLFHRTLPKRPRRCSGRAPPSEPCKEGPSPAVTLAIGHTICVAVLLKTFALSIRLHAMNAMKPDNVHKDVSYCHRSVPPLGLEDRAEFQYRVYALQLADDCVYVGIAHASQVKKTIGRHFEAKPNVHYTGVHRPRSVLLVWPAVSTAVEAYVYYAFLARMGSSATRAKQFALGGWVQTSSTLSPVATMVQEEARRQLRQECFNCGSRDHYASRCKAPLNGCTYKCPATGCKTCILVTSRGQTPQVSSSPASVPGASAAVSGSRAVPASSGTKRGAASSGPGVAPLLPVSKKQKLGSCNGGKEVLAMGEKYASLSWYLCNLDPTTKQINVARRSCSEHALELQGGHTRALNAAGFAAVPPIRPRSFTGDRTRLGPQFVASALKGVKVRRADDGGVSCRLSQVLFRVADLQQAFGG